MRNPPGQGRSGDGAESQHRIGYDELAGVWLPHNADSRVQGRRAVQIDRIDGARLAVAALQPATLSELGERLQLALASREARRRGRPNAQPPRHQGVSCARRFCATR